ncbi:LacI family DNA-binding transcriptional regulator [Aquabacterium sp.]|uniref:LacI family DNA-binding transcriptional regulator n=1 Tax=Aquabacterium sp. TaxID=1872578 RepID=UPI002C3CE49B|nr:LacI family DNA-binding transcriptional regulator [Aquabacterium sp.]HSW04029.1 LacI family DNA-binding transcriptional regulator [Aquabacterium sp.]
MPRPNRVQMADLARIAGVSVATVSRALNDSPLINADTRERIHTLARAMNYSINVGAQNLRLKQNRTVAVIVPYDPQTRQHLSDPFFLSLIGSLADALTERGHDMLLTRIDADRLDLAAQVYHTGRAMGIVLVGQWHHHDQLNAMADSGLPLVVWGAKLPRQRYATVGGDNLTGGRLATAHLLAQGARRVVFFGDTELPEIGLRCQGWRAAHAAAGLVPDEALCRPVPFVGEAIQQAVEQMLHEGLAFDAIFAASDLMAMTVIGTLRRLGRSVPEDVLLVSYDDIALAAHFHPTLSTVSQPIEQAGVLLVESLFAQLAGDKVGPKVMPTELVVRQSSQRPASGHSS